MQVGSLPSWNRNEVEGIRRGTSHPGFSVVRLWLLLADVSKAKCHRSRSGENSFHVVKPEGNVKRFLIFAA